MPDPLVLCDANVFYSILDRFAIACVGQFGKLSHERRPIATAHPYTQLQTDLVTDPRRKKLVAMGPWPVE